LVFLHQCLGDDFEVYFQPFLNGDRPDIIVMRKGSGVLVFEVKDWNLDAYYIDPHGKWRLKENDASIENSPLEQVRAYKQHLYDWHIDGLLKKGLDNDDYFGVVYCAIYFHRHDEVVARRFCENGDGYTQILGRDSLIEDRLRSLLHICYLDRQSRYFNNALYESFRRHLRPPKHMMEEGKTFDYKPKQKALMESHPIEQKIRGVAGSGKTTVLAKRAVNACLRTGSRVLVLTFNITLRNYIHDKISEVKAEFKWDGFCIIHYDLFFEIEANNYNLPVKDWERDRSNIKFFAPVEHETCRYDAIFVDEIQDYKAAWISIIKRYFLTKGGEFVVFGDEKQNIYGRTLEEDKKPNTTIPGRWNELTDSFRSSSKIMRLAIEFQKHFFHDKYDLDVVDKQRDLFGETQHVKYIDMKIMPLRSSYSNKYTEQ